MAFVKDGFSANAALFTPLWLAAHKLWWALAAYLAGLALLVGVLLAFDVGLEWIALLALAYHVVWGFEADELQRRTLESRGWETVGTVSGRNLAECERRFFDSWLPGQPILTPMSRATPPPPPAATPSGPQSASARPSDPPDRRRSVWRRVLGSKPA